MKKFLITLSIILMLVALYLGYELKQAKDELLMPTTGDRETISQLENELNIKTEKISSLQSEIQLLKDTLESLNSLQVEKSEVENSSSGDGNNSNLGDNTNTSDNGSSTSNTTITNGKEVGIIKQIYNDPNGNRKLEIDYVQLKGYGDVGCDYPLCIVNENSKLRTFTVSNNVEIIMKTLDYTKPTTISYDYLYQIFNTDNYSEYKYLKDIPFRITIENNVVTKIEEQFLS